MKISLRIILILCLFSCCNVFSQDSLYFRKTIETLSSPEFKGRGYAFKGDSIAAEFIASEFNRMKLQQWSRNFRQPMTIGINVFEDKAMLGFDNQTDSLQLFENFQFMAYSSSLEGSFEIKKVKAKDIYKQKIKPSEKLKEQFLWIDISSLDKKDSIENEIYKSVVSASTLNRLGAKGYILISENLMPWHLAHAKLNANHVTVNLKKESLQKTPKQISVNLDRRHIYDYQTQNICAYVEGKTHPDSFFVFVAHYDHLGCFGKDYIFYGANDNASGTAFVLSLAQHFSKSENRPDYSIAFITTTCEEIGLTGAFHYVENSFFPLENIKTVVNFDMVGTGENGVTFVCGEVFPEEFDKFKKINDKNNFLSKIVPRGASSNSDHYPFYKKDIRSFFIYGMGKSGKYHHASDTLENLSLGGYNGLFKLITEYINLYNSN